MNDTLRAIPAITRITTGADALDIKRAVGTPSLREFVAAFMAYQPGWVTFLYRVRAAIVPLLGLRQDGIPRPPVFAPADVPMTPGARVAVFAVEAAAEDHYWIGCASDDHLRAYLAIVREPLVAERAALDEQRSRFYVITAVHYSNWAGPVYYTLIRPFHHLVVGRMVRAGIRARP